MLEKYRDGQTIVYNTLLNSIKNNKLSHAYLFDSNGNSDVNDIVISFVKMILCNDENDSNVIDNICRRIDDGNYLDVKIIEPDGLWIKKNQMIDLQSEFSKKSVEGNKKIYIIKSAEKMNSQTANSILKFLEEPVDDIIAILIVDNINLVLPTILSRCQILKLNMKNYSDNSFSNINDIFYDSSYSKLNDSDKLKFIDDVLSFVSFFENNRIDTLIYTKKIWHGNFKDREFSLLAIELMIYIYYDILKYKYCCDNLFFCDKIDFIKKIASINDLNSICRKIEVLDKNIGYLRGNLNMNLLIDKLIIDMCGDYDENSKC